MNKVTIIILKNQFHSFYHKQTIIIKSILLKKFYLKKLDLAIYSLKENNYKKI